MRNNIGKFIYVDAHEIGITTNIKIGITTILNPLRYYGNTQEKKTSFGILILSASKEC